MTNKLPVIAAGVNRFGAGTNLPKHGEKIPSEGVQRSPFIILLFVANWLCGISAPLKLQAVELHVEGSCDRILFKEGIAAPMRTEKYVFVVDYSRPLWRIRTRDLSGIQREAETTYDGTNFLTYMPRDPREFKAPVTTNTFVGMAYVNRHSVPHTWFRPEHSALWLAFCASDYLRTNTGSMAPLCFYDHLGADFEDIYRFEPKLPLKVLWHPGCETTPAEVRIFHDGFIRGWNSLSKSWVAKPESVALPPPFQGGYLLSQLTLVTTTNIGGIGYASGVELTGFGRIMQNPRPENMTFPLEKFSIQATNWESISLTKQFQPKLTGRFMVTENRFEADGKPAYSFNYAATRWLADSEVKRLPEYLQQVQMQQKLLPQLEAK